MSLNHARQDKYSAPFTIRWRTDAYRQFSEGYWFVGLVALYLVLISAGKIVEVAQIGDVPVRLSQVVMAVAILLRAPFLLQTMRSPTIGLLAAFVIYSAIAGYLYW